jgi:membrane dipeptidase
MTAAESAAERAARLHREAIVIDGHSDVLMAIADGKMRLGDRIVLPDPAGWQPPLGWRTDAMSGLYNFSPHTAYFQTMGQYDLPRMRAGGLTAQSMAIYIGDEHVEVALHRALEMVYWLRREAAEHADFELVTGADDIRRIKRAGHVGGILAFEGFEPLGVDLKLLDVFYDLGLRIATLTHSRRNFWADGTQPGVLTAGLTAGGRAAIRRMNELGIVIDLAHLAYEGAVEVTELSDAPVILSHGSVPFMFRGGSAGARSHLASEVAVRTLAEAIAKSGGVIGEIAYSHPTLDAMLDDIDTLVSWVGVDHVGLGSDFFGIERAPIGYQSIDQLPNVTGGLVARGYADDDVLKILGGNFLRVFAAVWR